MLIAFDTDERAVREDRQGKEQPISFTIETGVLSQTIVTHMPAARMNARPVALDVPTTR